MTKLTWDTLDIPASLQQAIDEKEYLHPTPVQAQAIPKALSGTDLIVRSQTGTGKTAAFLIPALCRIPDDYGTPACLVLCPTRELAIQVAQEAESLVKHRSLRVCAVYGGVAIGPQTDALNAGAEIIVGTPGRVLDHLNRGNLKLGKLMVGTLDEADEMLSMGFLEEVTKILKKMPKEVQMLLFSATIEERLKSLIGAFLKDPEEIYVSTDGDQAAETVNHIIYKTIPGIPKTRQLLYAMKAANPKSAIVFCNTKSDTAVVARYLVRQGYEAQDLSSDIKQKNREKIMHRIKNHEIDILVATDIAARGIDISKLSHVFNYSLPEDPAVYLHRTGRTGRIGNKGTAITLDDGGSGMTRTILVGEYGVKFEELSFPEGDGLQEQLLEWQLEEIKAAPPLVADGYLATARKLRDMGPQGDMIIAKGLYLLLQWAREQKRAEARPNKKIDSEERESSSRNKPPRKHGNHRRRHKKRRNS